MIVSPPPLIEGGVVRFFFAVEITTHCRPLTYCSKLVSSKTIVRLISPDDKLNVASTRCTSDSNVRWVAFHLTPTEARIRGSRWTWPVVWINLTSHLWAFSDVYKKICQDTSCALSQAPSRWQARDTVRTPQRPRLGMSQSAKGLLFLS